MSGPSKRTIGAPTWLALTLALALLGARWPAVLPLGGYGITLTFVLMQIKRWREQQTLPRFSLRAVLLLTGLVASGFTYAQRRAPWRKAHAFPSFAVNVAMSPDGSLVAASQGTSIEIRETKTGRILQTLDMPSAEGAKKAGTNWTYELAFSDDNATLLAAGWRDRVHLYDWRSGVSLRSWSNGLLPRISRSGRRFATLPRGGGVEVCGVDRDEPLLTLTPSQISETREVFGGLHPQLSPSGKYVVVPPQNGALQVWRVDTGEKRLEIPSTFRHPAWLILRFSPDEKRVAIPTESGIAVWDVEQATPIGAWSPRGFDHLRFLEWSPDGARLLVSYTEKIGPPIPKPGRPNAITHGYLLDQNGAEIAKINGNGGAFSPSGDRITVAYGRCHILEGWSGRRLHTIPDSDPGGSYLGRPPLFYSPDGKWLFTQGDGAVYQKIRSEWWHSVLTLPTYWGTILFAVLLVREVVSARARRAAPAAPLSSLASRLPPPAS